MVFTVNLACAVTRSGKLPCAAIFRAWSWQAGKRTEMSLQDPIADMLTRVRNAQKASKQSVQMPASKHKARIAAVLKDEGYIRDFKLTDDKLPQLVIELKYYQGKPVIEEVKRISR